jgi:polyhydroxyalkanoate synthase subunit PhaC
MAQQMVQDPFHAARTLGFEVHDPQKFAQNMARLIEETGKR